MTFQQVVSKVGEAIAFSALPVALIAVGPTAAKAANLSPQNIDQMYVFGDSLSDTGNTFTVTGGALPPPPYFQGRYSNGPVWVDDLAQDLGITLTPFAKIATGASMPTAGINFAFGGSTTGTENTLNYLLPPGSQNLPGLQQQIGAFTSLVPATQAADPNALYVLWAGANDYLPTEGNFVPYQQTGTTLTNLSQAVNSLAAVGAKNIMVVNLPDLGKLPATRGTAEAGNLNTLTAEHNSNLFSTLQSTVNPSVNIIPFDINSIVNRAIATPSEFGFTNVTDACLNLSAGTICSNPNEYLFWDERHPTSAAHQIVADAALSALQPQSVPEPSAELGIFVFGAIGAGSFVKRKSKQDSRVKISA
jgi:phospholipase/lecithinase/hemolysin